MSAVITHFTLEYRQAKCQGHARLKDTFSTRHLVHQAGVGNMKVSKEGKALQLGWDIPKDNPDHKLLTTEMNHWVLPRDRTLLTEVVRCVDILSAGSRENTLPVFDFFLHR